MTSFPTTGPITASLDIAWGDIRIVAGDEAATVVEVTPTDPRNDKDRQAAQDTTVTCADGRLRVAGPRNLTGIFNKKYGSVQVSVRMAAGSELDVHSALGAIAVEGDGPAVAAHEEAITLQPLQIAPDGLLCDTKLVGDLGHADAPLACEQVENRPLARRGEHRLGRG